MLDTLFFLVNQGGIIIMILMAVRYYYHYQRWQERKTDELQQNNIDQLDRMIDDMTRKDNAPRYLRKKSTDNAPRCLNKKRYINDGTDENSNNTR